ncbi:MAG: hypothetical protein ABSH52_21555 [Terriglobia bacterium]
MKTLTLGRFPDFSEDFKYADVADDSLRNSLIDRTVTTTPTGPVYAPKPYRERLPAGPGRQAHGPESG